MIVAAAPTQCSRSYHGHRRYPEMPSSPAEVLAGNTAVDTNSTAAVPVVATATRHRELSSRPSGNSSNTSGSTRPTAHGQPPLVSVAISRQPAASAPGDVAAASTAYPAPETV